MPSPPSRPWHRALAVIAACVALPSGAAADEGAANAAGASALRARFAELRESLARNDFGRPLHLESAEGDSHLDGHVYALLSHPFPKVRDGLAQAASWCELLTLPFNVKRCEANGAEAISLFIARTPDTPVEEATRIDFRYTLRQRAGDLLEVHLNAPSGPAGTRNYRIVLEAVPVEAGRTFLHLSYGYGYGAVSRLAMQAYLATSGSGKVGFTREKAEGGERLVGGMRGVLERNTMRYFLAIEAYLDTLSVPIPERAQQRLLNWFDAAERYPRQLHEMPRERYMALKQRDLALAGTPAARGS